jgi:hypothetical protein
VIGDLKNRRRQFYDQELSNSRAILIQSVVQIAERMRSFSGEMTMVVTFDDADSGTEVTLSFQHLPPDVRHEDNDAGARASLEKLARYVHIPSSAFSFSQP